MATEFIFVYGTLRKQTASSKQHLLANYCAYFSEGVMPGKPYEVCGYPGAIESSNANHKVFGELYKILDQQSLLERLDEYEECSDRFPMPHEYSRKQRSIELVSGDSVVAWVYLYNHDVSTLQQIISGDYLGG
ncbi:MAG: gamma-glutamylcyclotransferase family protein [Methylococcaceae bacterium]